MVRLHSSFSAGWDGLDTFEQIEVEEYDREIDRLREQLLTYETLRRQLLTRGRVRLHRRRRAWAPLQTPGGSDA